MKIVCSFCVITLWSLVFAIDSCNAQEPTGFTASTQPLLRGHAHNDYLHSRPLLDALSQGFCSIEADIFLVDGELLVGHDTWALKPTRTLQKLYLDPLRTIVKENGGWVYAPKVQLQLLIDLKSDGAKTYEKLHQVLAEYREMLTEVNEGEVTERAISVVISGNRPVEMITAQNVRYAAIDGRLSDLNSDAPSHLIPLISDRWPSHFRWKSLGAFSTEEKEKLEQILQSAHAAGRKVRFWATVDTVPMWEMLNSVGVDYINTDQLSGLAEFLNAAANQQ